MRGNEAPPRNTAVSEVGAAPDSLPEKTTFLQFIAQVKKLGLRCKQFKKSASRFDEKRVASESDWSSKIDR